MGVTPKTIVQWQQLERDPLPIARQGSRGIATEYNGPAVVKWFVRREISKRLEDVGGELFDYEAERARLTHEQADKTALEVEVLKGNLLPKERVIQEQSAMISAARARLLSLPIKAAPILINQADKREVESFLRELVYEALDELSEFDIADYLPDDQPEREDVETAAGADGKPVGGRAPDAEPRGKRRAGKVAD